MNSPRAGTKPETQTRRLRLRAEHLLPLVCAGASAMLAASEFMNTFKLNGPGPSPQAVQSAADQHHYALLILAGVALLALAIAVTTGSKPAASAVAICGAGAILIFLLIDLPDAGKVGSINDVNLTEAKADPTTGFWLELTGALVLAVCGAALATLSPDQLRAFAHSAEGLRPSAKWRPPSRRAPAKANPGEQSEAADEPRRRRRSRARASEP